MFCQHTVGVLSVVLSVYCENTIDVLSTYCWCTVGSTVGVLSVVLSVYR